MNLKKAITTLAFASATLASATSYAKDPTIIVVTHGQASDPFWSIVKNGAFQAGKDMPANVDYRAPETFDMVTMSQLIDAAVNQSPDGIVISNPDPAALGPSIRRAISAGIPVISMNSGISAVDELGISLHVGQDEIQAGTAVGEYVKGLGYKKILCVNQEIGNVALDQRCQGVGLGFMGPVDVLPTTTDPAEIESKIKAALSSDSSIDFVIGLSAPLVGEHAVSTVNSIGMTGKIGVGSFDLSANFLKSIVDGEALFAVDQQPFLQGYLPVASLALNARYGTLPAGNVPSGPSFVTKDNAEQVIELSQQGIR